MYNIYHIPGKKIGVTRNLNKRVTEQQGYAPEEYEVLFTSDDIEIISAKEIELQKSYGYKVDRQTYKNLIKSNKMKINATEQTSTFPYPVNKLKGNLSDHIGAKWSTEFGTFEITAKTIPWIMQNCKTSMYNDKRSYIYNKALATSPASSISFTYCVLTSPLSNIPRCLAQSRILGNIHLPQAAVGL